MSDPALFDLTAPEPDSAQQCDVCFTARTATVDTLRVSGWIAYDGTSFTGRPLNVRICPACRRSKGEGHDAASDRLGSLPQVHPHLPGTDR